MIINLEYDNEGIPFGNSIDVCCQDMFWFLLEGKLTLEIDTDKSPFSLTPFDDGYKIRNCKFCGAKIACRFEE